MRHLVIIANLQEIGGNSASIVNELIKIKPTLFPEDVELDSSKFGFLTSLNHAN